MPIFQLNYVFRELIIRQCNIFIRFQMVAAAKCLLWTSFSLLYVDKTLQISTTVNLFGPTTKIQLPFFQSGSNKSARIYSATCQTVATANMPLANYASVPANNSLKSRLRAKFSQICCVFSHEAFPNRHAIKFVNSIGKPCSCPPCLILQSAKSTGTTHVKHITSSFTFWYGLDRPH